jgi:drug/metabolite transporter (DMT)-like permease
MVLLTWLVGGPRPGRYAIVGIVLGLAGVGLLVGPGKGAVDTAGAFAVIAASIGWALGTVFIKRVDRPASTFVVTGMEMLTGGAINIIVGLVTGESAQLHIAAISRESLLGFVYLIIFGSWVGYSAYTYLVENVSSPAQLGTYAYVNPCIALLLGWLIAGETIGPRTLVAMGIIVGAVVLLTIQPAAAQRPTATVSPSASSMASSTK